MRARRHSISCDLVYDDVSNRSLTLEAGNSDQFKAVCEVRLKIIFDEDESYYFGKEGSADTKTITFVTGDNPHWYISRWRNAFKKKKSV
jgi:hypothetical protein